MLSPIREYVSAHHEHDAKNRILDDDVSKSVKIIFWYQKLICEQNNLSRLAFEGQRVDFSKSVNLIHIQ